MRLPHENVKTKCQHNVQRPKYKAIVYGNIKMEFFRKLSNFNFKWTETLYQNNLKHMKFFFTFSMAIDVISHL